MKKFFFFYVLFNFSIIFSIDSPLATISNPIETDFATYFPFEVNVKPSIPPYYVLPDLSNIENKDIFELTEEDIDLLHQNLFFITSKSLNSNRTGYNEMYDIYIEAKEEGFPIFITTDIMFHTYHRLFDGILQFIEEENFYLKLKEIDLSLFQKAYELDNSINKQSSFLLAAYFALSSKLLDPSFSVPTKYLEVVNAEIELIEEHSNIFKSPIFQIYDIDYTQFKPRGHYTKSETLKKYFKAMMWHGKTAFILKDCFENPCYDTTSAALFLTQFMLQSEIETLWYSIYRPTIFFVGSADDLLYIDYLNVAKEVYGENFQFLSPEEIMDEKKLSEFIDKAYNELPDPKIWDIVGKGLRFMGQRFIPDSFIFTKLTHPAVPDRFMPKGLDVMAILGSDLAFEILKYLGEINYQNYNENMEYLKDYFKSLPEEQWVENLYFNWLYSLMSLLYPKGEGYPSFMQNTAWQKKDLNCALSSWTELRHDTILYAKQSTGGGGSPKWYFVLPSYVEPNPEAYSRLASLALYTLNGLRNLNLLNEKYEKRLESLIELLLKLKTISEKELTNQILEKEEWNLLANFGNIIKEFVSDPNSEEYVGDIEDDPIPIIADVHTDIIHNECLEEGVGFPMRIFVVVPHREKLYITVGAAFSYYEFINPISERLSDEEWREILMSENPPSLPFWVEDIKDNESCINSNPTFSYHTKFFDDVKISYEIEENKLILFVEIPPESLGIDAFLNNENLNVLDFYVYEKGTIIIFEIPEVEGEEVIVWIKGYNGLYERYLNIKIGDKSHSRPF